MKRWIISPALRPLWLVVMLVLLWDLGIRLFKIPPYLIPNPLSVVKQLGAEWPMLMREALPTLYATLGGFALSALIGVPIAMWIAYSRVVESFVYPLLVFSQSIPKVAIAPLFVVWFGFGVVPKVIAAFLLGFFPVVVSTVFSSILEPGLAKAISDSITRVLRPGGSVLLYDFRYRNPSNKHVHGVGRAEIAALFPGFVANLELVTLLPPLARRLGPLTPALYPVLAAIPRLRTHHVGLLEKPRS